MGLGGIISGITDLLGITRPSPYQTQQPSVGSSFDVGSIIGPAITGGITAYGAANAPTPQFDYGKTQEAFEQELANRLAIAQANAGGGSSAAAIAAAAQKEIAKMNARIALKELRERTLTNQRNALAEAVNQRAQITQRTGEVGQQGLAAMANFLAGFRRQ